MDRQEQLEIALHVIAKAKKHQRKGGMVSSAKLALLDADHLLKRGDYIHAAQRALTSMRFTIGITGRDYIACSKMIEGKA